MPLLNALNGAVRRPVTGFPFLDEPTGVIAFAHRGGAYHPELEGLENTVAAFRHAWELGYQYLETDVHATRDGILLAFHDEVLDRVTDRQGAIADLTYDDVRRALVGGREEVPTLGRLFDEFPDARFNIDLKSASAVRPLADFITARAAEERVLVGSFSPRCLREFRRLTEGRVPTSAHPGEVVVWLLSPTGRIAARLTGGRVSALQVPHRRGRLLVASRHLRRKAHAGGAHLHVWTVDDPDEMRTLIDRGVDGIFTDRTDLLKEVLAAAGDWREQG